jgi:glutaredoxin
VRQWRVGSLLLLGLAAPATPACDRSAQRQEQESGDLAPKSNELPPLELRDNTPNLLLTWVDDNGDFHVVQKPAEVPKPARDRVRVVVTTMKEGTGNLVYVANLNQKKPDGTYRVQTMTRAQWDEVGASRRQARLEALAPSAKPGDAAPGTAASAQQPATAGRVVAIVYGAQWCKPCHDAARYLKQLGVTVVEKNIESDPLAQREMVAKLSRANLPPSSAIPIIDVSGQVMVGFNPRAVSRAVQAAREARPL